MPYALPNPHINPRLRKLNDSVDQFALLIPHLVKSHAVGHLTQKNFERFIIDLREFAQDILDSTDEAHQTITREDRPL